MNHRRQRIARQLRDRLAQIIGEQIEDPRLRDLSVTGLEVSPDLSFARVWFRTLADPAAALEALESARSYLRHKLGEGSHLKRVPELQFRLDESLDKAQRIEEILRELKEDSR